MWATANAYRHEPCDKAMVSLRKVVNLQLYMSALSYSLSMSASIDIVRVGKSALYSKA